MYSLELLVEGQKLTQKDLQLGLIGLAKQNNELLYLNKELNEQLKTIKKDFNALKKEQEEKAERRKAWSKRKRLPKRQPITPDIYQLLIQEITSPHYTSIRLRIALCILTVTGIRVNELLPLKVKQLKTLVESYWIEIDRSKRGPASHKAFLSAEGRRLVNERKKDFKLFFLMKDSDSYVFTSESDHSKMLSREAITRDINKVLRAVSNNLSDKPYITSHSFRIGYISKLWKDTEDIEFVRQSIGHLKIDSTSAYVKDLSDRERRERTLLLK